VHGVQRGDDLQEDGNTLNDVTHVLEAAGGRHRASPRSPCPLILDDVTVQSDDERTRAILDLLAALLHLPVSLQSRRASMATSRPILFRYLKQSATVFAGDATRTVTLSIVRPSIPSVSAAPEKRTMRKGRPVAGMQSLTSIATQTR
jgi:hypothetical protein